MRSHSSSVIILLFVCVGATAFLPAVQQKKALVTTQKALWRHFVPRQETILKGKPPKVQRTALAVDSLIQAFAACLLTVVLSLPANAVSGGGLDYANLDITGQDFSGGSYKSKDFTQTIAKGTKFMKSNLQGCRFYKAFLVNTDFSGADLRGASLEDTSMDGALLTGANAAGAYFSASILEAGSLENVDFTDASLPVKTLALVCERPDVKGTNPATGVDTRESLMCP